VPFAVSRGRLLALIDGLAGRRLVVAGDFVLDRFVYGHPKRVSREAPVLILRYWKEESLPGGAGNTAANVRALGGTPVPVGAIGRDEAGAALREALRDAISDIQSELDAAGWDEVTQHPVLNAKLSNLKRYRAALALADH